MSGGAQPTTSSPSLAKGAPNSAPITGRVSNCQDIAQATEGNSFSVLCAVINAYHRTQNTTTVIQSCLKEWLANDNIIHGYMVTDTSAKMLAAVGMCIQIDPK